MTTSLLSKRLLSKNLMVLLLALFILPSIGSATDIETDLIDKMEFIDNENIAETEMGNACLIGYINVSECGATDGYATVLPSSNNGTSCGYLNSWWQRFLCYIRWFFGERTYEWSNGETTRSISNLAPGEYCVTVTDQWTGAVSHCCVTISGPENCCPDLVCVAEGVNPTCSGGASDGEILVTADGGDGTYEFTINPGNISNTDGQFTNLTPGTYTIDAIELSSGCPAPSEEISLASSDCGGTFECGNSNTILPALQPGFSWAIYPISPATCTGEQYQLVDSDADGAYEMVIPDGADADEICANIIAFFPFPVSDEQLNDPNFEPCFCPDPANFATLCADETPPLAMTQSDQIAFIESLQNRYKHIENNVDNTTMVKAQGISVFPNPFTESFTVNMTNDQNAATTIEVINMIGKIVQSVDLSPNQKQQIITLTNQPNGIYHLRFVTNNELIETQKIVKTW